MKIIQERKRCIGCGSCVAVCDKYFEVADDGLASLKGGQMSGDNMVLEIQAAGCVTEAAQICPVQIISVK